MATSIYHEFGLGNSLLPLGSMGFWGYIIILVFNHPEWDKEILLVVGVGDIRIIVDHDININNLKAFI